MGEVGDSASPGVVMEHKQIRPKRVRGEDPCVSFWAHRVETGKFRQAGEFGMHLAMTGKP